MAKNKADNYDALLEDIELEEEDSEEQNWEDWKADDGDDNDSGEENLDSQLVCLFCDSVYRSSDELFQHCTPHHHFDFHNIRTALGLDFYGSFKLINYVRSQVAQSQCWSCGLTCHSKQDLQNHLHETVGFENPLPWDDDQYLKPFVQGDSLLYSFSGDDEFEDEFPTSIEQQELLKNFDGFEKICIDNENEEEQIEFEYRKSLENGTEAAFTPERNLNVVTPSENVVVNSFDAIEEEGTSSRERKDNHWKAPPANIVGNNIKNVNNNYFGAYSSFGIHREMISDKVRTDAYREAILNNPSLLKGSVVLDVGCGTGILSLFAAQAGASRVIAVEASEKMATVATQIAKDNGLLWNGSLDGCNTKLSGVIKVVHSMVEQLDKSGHIHPFSVDILLSEWMGYCLLYESMLSSVLFARDRWLKPGGAILPDTATMFVAGFGKGGTSIPFWENVYGFDMSCVGKELTEDAGRVPIVDVIDSCDIVTNNVILQTFDLATMKREEMDFTSKVELNPKSDALKNNPADIEPQTAWCYGLVLWFETGFTSRFCKEMPTVLSTSPFTPKTHWAQTILTFREPVAMALGKSGTNRLASLGTDAYPAVKLHSRISIVRATQHRSIDISMEITAIGSDGRRRSWPAQLFNLY